MNQSHADAAIVTSKAHSREIQVVKVTQIFSDASSVCSWLFWRMATFLVTPTLVCSQHG
jgi:hypothetical protein